MIRVPEFCTEPNKARLLQDPLRNKLDALGQAQMIRDAWRRAGWPDVKVSVRATHDEDGRIIAYTLKSDLINGLPRSAVARKVA
jgi:hypothetical protein